MDQDSRINSEICQKQADFKKIRKEYQPRNAEYMSAIPLYVEERSAQLADEKDAEKNIRKVTELKTHIPAIVKDNLMNISDILANMEKIKVEKDHLAELTNFLIR